MGLAADYDHFNAEGLPEPYDFWKELRDREPVARSECYGGFHVVSRYADISEAAQDPERFSSTKGTGIPPLPMVGMIPIDIDPPDQREYRGIINPALTVSAVASHEEPIRELARSLIEPLVGRDELEVAETLAIPLPPRATLEFIGFPREDHELVARATDDITHLRGTDSERIMQAGMEVLEATNRLVATRREQPRREDLLSLMFDGTFYDRPLEDEEIVRTVALLLFGAVDTTASAIAGSIYYMATHPDIQERLRAQRPIDNLALEELVRWTTPIQGLGRTVTRKTELGGCPLHEGDRVFLLWAAGNRDPSVFSDPDQVDLERKPNRHLGFGMGPHRCVGVHLGKLMLRVTLEEFLARIGPFELGDPAGMRWMGGEARGLRRLPVRLV